MVIKKHITALPYDKDAEKKYYTEAKICPHCKNSDSVIEDYFYDAWIFPHTYRCYKCGCEWAVKKFKKKRIMI